MKKVLTVLALTLLLGAGANSVLAYSVQGEMAYNEGLDFYNRGEYGKAIQSFKNAVAQDTDFADAYYNLGSLYEFLKSYQSAISAYTKLNQLEPSDKEIVYKLAELYHKVNNSERALYYISKISKDDDVYTKAQNLKNQIVLAAQKSAAKNALSINNSAIANNRSVVDKYSGPTGLAVDSKGVLYVASYTDNCIYKVTPDGQSQLYLKNSVLGGPIGLAVDALDNLYIANYAKNNILKVNKSGQIYTFMSNITKPYYLIIKGGNMFITEQGNNTVVKYKLY